KGSASGSRCARCRAVAVEDQGPRRRGGGGARIKNARGYGTGGARYRRRAQARAQRGQIGESRAQARESRVAAALPYGVARRSGLDDGGVAMMGRIIEAVRRVLRVGPAPDTTPIETPFIEEMKRERDRSHRRRLAHRGDGPSS